jgi:hypothetical protein
LLLDGVESLSRFESVLVRRARCARCASAHTRSQRTRLVAGLNKDHHDAPCRLLHADVYEMNETIGLVRLRPRQFRRVINTSIERRLISRRDSPVDCSREPSRAFVVSRRIVLIKRPARTPRRVTTYGNGGPILALEGTAICFADTPWLSPSTMRERPNGRVRKPYVRGEVPSHIERT